MASFLCCFVYDQTSYEYRIMRNDKSISSSNIGALSEILGRNSFHDVASMMRKRLSSIHQAVSPSPSIYSLCVSCRLTMNCYVSISRPPLSKRCCWKLQRRDPFVDPARITLTKSPDAFNLRCPSCAIHLLRYSLAHSFSFVFALYRHKGFLKDCPNGLLTEKVNIAGSTYHRAIA